MDIELARTFIEITESGRIKELLDQLQGIDSGQALYLELGSERINGVFESGHSKEDKLSAVHYLRFRLSADQQATLRDHPIAADFVVDHPRYHARTPVSEEVRKSLIQDLTITET